MRGILLVAAVVLGCASPRGPEPVATAPEPSAASVAAPPSASSTAPVASISVAPATTASASASAPPPDPMALGLPCNEITLGPCKVNFSARRTCLVASGYFSIDETKETPAQRAKFFACIKKVQTLPAGPKECTDAGTKCADAVSAQWFDKGPSDALPTVCAVPAKCAATLDTSCGAAKKLIDDCYYAARNLKKP